MPNFISASPQAVIDGEIRQADARRSRKTVARQVAGPLNDYYSDLMTRQVTATEAKAKLLALLDDVEKGEEIEITRHGHTIARISPARGPHSLKDLFKGIVTTNATDEELFSTGETWEVMRDDDTP
jgi:prevent-host-death family protein